MMGEIKCCHEFVHGLNSLQDFPITRQDATQKIEGFSQISKMLSVMVTVDGTPTPIKAPKNNHEDYFNQKHFYSYVIMPFIGANESCEETLRLRVAVERSIVIGSCTLGIKTHKNNSNKTTTTTTTNLPRLISWTLRVIFQTYPWIFNTGNLHP